MLASASPSHRVQGLEEAGSLEASDAGFGHGKSSVLSARREAALLLGYLERLAEPYAPPEVICAVVAYAKTSGIQGIYVVYQLHLCLEQALAPS